MIGRAIAWLWIAAGTFCAVDTALAAQPPTYSVVEVTALIPTALNNRGDMVGSVGSQAALYRDGHLQLLGTLGGGTSYATDLNDAGQVTGWSLTASGAKHAFLYSDGSMFDLGTLGGASSEGASINASGQVVGTSVISTGAYRAFFYNGTMADLGTFEGGTRSQGFAINNLGQVVGNADGVQPGEMGYFYDAGVLYDIGFSSCCSQLEIHGINDRAQVAGFLCDPIVYCQSFTYDGNTKTGMLLPRYGNDTEVWAINDAGWIVGSGFKGSDPNQALLYIDRQSYNLNQYVDASGKGVLLNDAFDINDGGQILSHGLSGHYYLLSPVPEPQTWTLMLLGMILLTFVGRRHGQTSITA